MSTINVARQKRLSWRQDIYTLQEEFLDVTKVRQLNLAADIPMLQATDEHSHVVCN
jgi:hypothetical protein